MRALKVFIPIIFLISITASAQQREPAGLTDFPVPAWPENGVIPPELKEKYVFIDLARNEYVLAYPQNLGTPEFEKNPGELRISRFELQRGVEPVLGVAVSRAGQKYRYDYTVKNASNAKQAIDSWNIIIPEQPGNTTMQHPPKWASVLQKDRNLQVRKPEWIRTGASALWAIMGREEVIAAGGSKVGFILESDLRPGFTLAYFRKALVIIGPSTATAPKAVIDQVDSLLKLEYNSKTVATIGPKFAADTPNQVVVADFLEGIEFLTRTGALNSTSEFVNGITAELKAGVPSALTSQPRTEMEVEIATALKASLRLN